MSTDEQRKVAHTTGATWVSPKTAEMLARKRQEQAKESAIVEPPQRVIITDIQIPFRSMVAIVGSVTLAVAVLSLIGAIVLWFIRSGIE